MIINDVLHTDRMSIFVFQKKLLPIFVFPLEDGTFLAQYTDGDSSVVKAEWITKWIDSGVWIPYREGVPAIRHGVLVRIDSVHCPKGYLFCTIRPAENQSQWNGGNPRVIITVNKGSAEYISDGIPLDNAKIILDIRKICLLVPEPKLIKIPILCISNIQHPEVRESLVTELL